MRAPSSHVFFCWRKPSPSDTLSVVPRFRPLSHGRPETAASLVHSGRRMDPVNSGSAGMARINGGDRARSDASRGRDSDSALVIPLACFQTSAPATPACPMRGATLPQTKMKSKRFDFIMVLRNTLRDPLTDLNRSDRSVMMVRHDPPGAVPHLVVRRFR
jgi:hypothetical protein